MHRRTIFIFRLAHLIFTFCLFWLFLCFFGRFRNWNWFLRSTNWSWMWNLMRCFWMVWLSVRNRLGSVSFFRFLFEFYFVSIEIALDFALKLLHIIDTCFFRWSNRSLQYQNTLGLRICRFALLVLYIFRLFFGYFMRRFVKLCNINTVPVVLFIEDGFWFIWCFFLLFLFIEDKILDLLEIAKEKLSQFFLDFFQILLGCHFIQPNTISFLNSLKLMISCRS